MKEFEIEITQSCILYVEANTEDEAIEEACNQFFYAPISDVKVLNSVELED